MQTVTDYFVKAAAAGGFIRKMFEKGLELKSIYGEDAVCDFSLGNPDVPPPEKAREVLHHTNLIREIKGYWWGKGDVPRKRDDHALDELRYFLMMRPEGVRPKVELTAVQKDKQRLIRAANKNKRRRLNL